MNDMIDTASDLRDLITVDYREVNDDRSDNQYVVNDHDEEQAEQVLRWQESMTMEDILEG